MRCAAYGVSLLHEDAEGQGTAQALLLTGTRSTAAAALSHEQAIAQPC